MVRKHWFLFKKKMLLPEEKMIMVKEKSGCDRIKMIVVWKI